MSAPSDSTEGPSNTHRRKSQHRRAPKQRKAAAATLAFGAQEAHASQADPVPHVTSQKTPQTEKATSSSSSTPSPPTEQSSSTSTLFDPKSIVPDTKPKKDLSRLVRASKNKPIAFNCIDGAVRGANPSESARKANVSTSRFDEYVAAPEAQPDSNTEDSDQFTAYGIPAYPTRAIFNDICHDFVMPDRWCRNGCKCTRIHPLNKRAYRHISRKEQRLFENMKTAAPPAVANSEKIVDSTRNPNKPSSAKTSAKDDVHDWDVIWGLDSKHNNSSAGASSSSSGGTDPWSTGSDWDHVDTSMWESATDSNSETAGKAEDATTVRQGHTAANMKGKEKQISSSEPAGKIEVTSLGHKGHAAGAKSKGKEVVSRVADADKVKTNQPERTQPTPSVKGKEKEVAPPVAVACVKTAKDMPPPPTGLTASAKGKGKQATPNVAPVHPLPSNPPPPSATSKAPTQQARIQQTPTAGSPRSKHPAPPPSAASNASTQHVPTSSSMPAKSSASTPATDSAKPALEGKLPPRPQNAALCKRWVRGECGLEYNCYHVHGDLEYDDPLPELPAVEAPERWTRTIHDHIRVHMSSGFEIEDVSTGFESASIMVGNLPNKITEEAITRLVRPFGEVVQIKRPINAVSPMVMRVDFSDSFSAYRAWATLHGKSAFGAKLDVRMAITNKKNGSLIQDTVVRLDWDYPHRIVFIGFATMELAKAAVETAKHTLYDGLYQTSAEVHIGTPAVGTVTVKFYGVPAKATKEGMYVFGPHQDMMVTRMPNYNMTMEDNVEYIKRVCKQFPKTMTQLEFRPGPYSGGKARAWVHFRTAADASFGVGKLNGKKNDMLGDTRLSAKHLKTISFDVPKARFAVINADIRILGDNFVRKYHYQPITIVNKGSHSIVRLSSDDLGLLCKLRDQVEPHLNGRLLLTETEEVAWDDFFATKHAEPFFEEMRSQFERNLLDVDAQRRTMRMYGSPWRMETLRFAVVHRLQEVQSYKWHTINLDGRLATAFSGGPYDELQAEIGADRLQVDYYRRRLIVRGDVATHAKVAAAVARLREQLPYDQKVRKALLHECPVCLEEATPPVLLSCGHAMCQPCMKSYLLASVDQKLFPLSCVGDEGKCTVRIPLRIAKLLLTADELDSVVEAAFRVYTQKRGTSFRFCPTPNCAQVYRAVPPYLREGKGAFVQCPSCLVRTCAQCHQPEHPGLTCKRADSAELFKEWAMKNNAKPCPGCRMVVEKIWGCHHMECTQCRTHFCWVCGLISTSDEIYPHMNLVHGNIGLVPDGQPIPGERMWW